MKIYVLTIVQASIEDTVCLDTYVFNNIEEAKAKAEAEEKEWIEMHRTVKHDVWDMTDENFEKWILDSLQDDLSHPEGMYKSYIYDDGEEKVFSIECHDMQINIG